MNGILLPKLFWPTARKSCTSGQEKLLKFEAECHEFAEILRSVNQYNFWNRMLFQLVPEGFSDPID